MLYYLYRSYSIVVDGFTKMIPCYIITMKKEDRLNNIHNQFSKMNSNGDYKVEPILVDAVVGKNIDIDELIQKGQIDSRIKTEKVNAFNENFENRKNEIGCYLSHMKIYDMVQQNGSMNPFKYSIIFEDDFEVNNNFMDQIEKTISAIEKQNLSFDLIMLGMFGGVGDQVQDNIYNLKCSVGDCFHTHAILMNNESAGKLLEVLHYIDNIIDVQLFKKNNEKKLNIYRLNPSISTQNSNIGGTIRIN